MGLEEVGEAMRGTCPTWIRLGENPLGRRVLIMAQQVHVQHMLSSYSSSVVELLI